jgi:hypothetical protein
MPLRPGTGRQRWQPIRLFATVIRPDVLSPWPRMRHGVPGAAGSGDTEPLAPPRRTGCAVARRPVRRVQNAPLGADVLLPFATCSLPATSLPATPQCLMVDIGGDGLKALRFYSTPRYPARRQPRLPTQVSRTAAQLAPTLRRPARLTTLPFGFNCATNAANYV